MTSPPQTIRFLLGPLPIRTLKRGNCGGDYGFKLQNKKISQISYLAQSTIKTALIPIGYSSGYSRSLNNKGLFLICGQRCSVIGVVNMKMVIADTTNVPDAKVGDEIIITGKQGGLELKLSVFSDISGQRYYEVLAHLSESIKRIVI